MSALSVSFPPSGDYIMNRKNISDRMLAPPTSGAIVKERK